MSIDNDSNCPLCRSRSRCEDHLWKRTRHFDCGVCGNIVIKNQAERIGLDFSEEIQQQYSRYRAGAPDGQVTLISIERNGPDAGPSVVAEYLSLRDALAR